MTLQDLLQIIHQTPLAVRAKGLKQEIAMSSDEEGNEMLGLHQVEIDSVTGQMTLWPMHLNCMYIPLYQATGRVDKNSAVSSKDAMKEHHGKWCMDVWP
jgi:hypothetical protein